MLRSHRNPRVTYQKASTKAIDWDKIPAGMSNFGASLKKARESKEISLDQIAAETRISTRFLKAIEDEEFHVLPGGIFNRGFIRAYAERVGLDPEQAVADYERLADISRPSEVTAASSIPQKKKKSDRHLYPIAVGGLALLVAIFYIATRDSGKSLPPQSQPAAVVSEPAPPPSSVPAPETAAAAAEPEAKPPAPANALTLDIETNATTWIKLRADGNTIVSGEILEPGVTRRFTAQESLNLIVGNAGGIALKINDQPMKPLGQSGQVREVTITPQNLKDFTG